MTTQPNPTRWQSLVSDISRRVFLKRSLLGASLLQTAPLVAGPAKTSHELSTRASKTQVQAAAQAVCNRASNLKLELQGSVGSYLAAVTDHWLKVAPLSNYGMLEMFRDRDRKPLRDMVPWAGEFAGKYLTSAVQVWRTRRDPELEVVLKKFVPELIACQAEDGYLGPWPKDSRLTGHAPNAGKDGGPTWDAWGHYHVMLGLLLWVEETGEERALSSARRIGDLFCRRFEQTNLVDTGSTEMNLAPIHGLCLLFRQTGEDRYLRLAEKICREFAAKDAKGQPLAGDYLNAGLAGQEFFQMPKPRWESLHPIMGLVELYWLKGDERYRQAFEQIWWSIVKLDRHNNGGFSSGEQAQGNPYHPGAIETCCTIAWIALSVEMLRLTGNSVVADELELSTVNSVIGMHSPTGRWVTYNTPMDGTRKASAHDIVFQARAGTPELNCCSVNGARGLGMISDWGLMESNGTLILNWYGPGAMTAALRNGTKVGLVQKTDYPRDGAIQLHIEPSRAAEFALKLRIPYWSQRTAVQVNGRRVENVAAGQYLVLDRRWRRGDRIDLKLDFSPHFWAGERECGGKVSMYRGPVLLTYDRRFNEMDPLDVPALDSRGFLGDLVNTGDSMPPILLLECRAVNGQKVRLCDFGSAGAGGSPYRSWLEVRNTPPPTFSQLNPLRSARV